MDEQSKAALRRRMLARHRAWITENSCLSLSDSFATFPKDADVAALTQAMGRLYKLYYLIEQTETDGSR